MNENKLDFKNYLSSALLGLVVLIIYFVFPYLEAPLLQLFHVNTSTIPSVLKEIYIVTWEVIVLATMLLLFHESIKKNIDDLKKNHMEYFKKYFKYWLFALAIMMISNAIIMTVNGGNTSGNEETVRELFKTSPIYIYIVSVLIGPLMEELVFRKAIYNIVPIKVPFIIISGLVFGGLHVVGNVESWMDLLYLIPYCTPGFIFAYIMYKTDNVLVSSGLHFMHNGILMTLQFIVLIFS